MNYTIRTNRLMDDYLLKLGYDFWEKTIELPTDLAKITNSDFLTTNDCVTLKGFGHRINPKFDNDSGKCEWEYNGTHFHPDNYVDRENEIDFLKLALECSKRIFERLSNRFKNDRFRVIISFCESTIIDGEVDTYGSSTIRFYKIRSVCDEIMYIDNLNDFETDAVLEIETN